MFFVFFSFLKKKKSSIFFFFVGCSKSDFFWALNFVTISLDSSHVKSQFWDPSREGECIKKKPLGPLFIFSPVLCFFLAFYFSIFSFLVHFLIFDFKNVVHFSFF